MLRVTSLLRQGSALRMPTWIRTAHRENVVLFRSVHSPGKSSSGHGDAVNVMHSQSMRTEVDVSGREFEGRTDLEHDDRQTAPDDPTAKQRRQAIAQSGGYSYIVIKEDRFTDVTAQRKRRERTPRPWMGAYKPVILRRNTIMPAQESVITPLPKTILSAQYPLSYRQKQTVEAELEYGSGYEGDPHDPPPHAKEPFFFPMYMRFFAFLSHVIVTIMILYIFLFMDFADNRLTTWIRGKTHKKWMELFSLSEAEMKVLSKREAELWAEIPDEEGQIETDAFQLWVEKHKYQNSLTYLPETRPKPRPALTSA